MPPRHMNLRYALVHVSYWSAYGTVWAFIALLLTHYGMTGTQTGLITAAAAAASVVIAPALSSFISSRKGMLDRHGAMLLFGASGAIAFLVWRFPAAPKMTIAAAFVLLGAFLCSAPPFQNSMATEANRRGVPIVYGFGRGCGSMSYAVTVTLLGFVLERAAASVLLPVFAVTAALGVLALCLFRNPSERIVLPGDEDAHGGAFSVLRGNPRFTLTLLGCLFFFSCHMICNTYMNAIVARAGGSESGMGLALAISAVTELPAMTLISRYRTRLSSGFLLRLSGLGEIAKILVLLWAPSIGWVYFGVSLQFFQFAVYLPATVYYVSDTLRPADQLQGQSLIHVAGSGLGAALGNLLGGRLIDLGGIQYALVFAALCAAGAFVTFCLSTRKDIKAEQKFPLQ